MKKAVLVVGSHFSGKSKTINKYFKRLVGISEKKRIFTLRKKKGTALSQSTEEKRLGHVISQSIEEKRLFDLKEFLDKYLACQLLVLAARPEDEAGSNYKAICTILKKNGFSVKTVTVQPKQSAAFYKQCAGDILLHLS